MAGIKDKQSLSREERLRSRAELTAVYRSANRVGCSGLGLLYTENAVCHNRAAFVTSKGFKRAVDRNLDKRRGREIYRRMKYDLKQGYDLVFLLYPGFYSYSQRHSQMTRLCGRAGLRSQE